MERMLNMSSTVVISPHRVGWTGAGEGQMLADAWAWRQKHPAGYAGRDASSPTSFAERKRVAATAG